MTNSRLFFSLFNNHNSCNKILWNIGRNVNADFNIGMREREFDDLLFGNFLIEKHSKHQKIRLLMFIISDKC